MSSIAVIGSGYVGLTTAACLSHLGHSVIGADIDARLIEELNAGHIRLAEPGLPELVNEGLARKRLCFVVEAIEATRESEFVFICVPTPSGPTGATDMSFVQRAVMDVAPALTSEKIIVTKSTMPAGSTARVRAVLAAIGVTEHVSVVSNPEFLREGSAVFDFLNPDRIVIGSDEPAAGARVAALYGGLQTHVVLTDPASAELTKYATNAFLATKISFINAIANICEVVGADVSEVSRALSYDHRIGPSTMVPGPGYGGSCLPKDTDALLHTAQHAARDGLFLGSVVETNRQQPIRIVEKIRLAVGGSLADKKVAVWGLAYKANTNDLRGSVAVTIIRRLSEAGAAVAAYDPAIDPATFPPMEGVTVTADPYSACEGALALAVLTEWDQFRVADLSRAAALLAGRSVVDARNILSPDAVVRAGLEYQGIGRPSIATEGTRGQMSSRS